MTSPTQNATPDPPADRRGQADLADRSDDGPTSPQSPPVFVVHHAGSAHDLSYVQRFFLDLRRQVAAGQGVGSNAVGRLLGPEAPSLSSPSTPVSPSPAVLTCHAMVALYSEHYFADRQCTVDWHLFRERTRWHRRMTGRASTALVGVRWAVRPEIETVLAGIDVVGLDDVGNPVDVCTGSVGTGDARAGKVGAFDRGTDDYRGSGLLRVMRRQPGSAVYQAVLAQVADVLTASFNEVPPRIPTADLRHLTFSDPPLPTDSTRRADSMRKPAALSGSGRAVAWREHHRGGATTPSTRRPILRRVDRTWRSDDD